MGHIYKLGSSSIVDHCVIEVVFITLCTWVFPIDLFVSKMFQTASYFQAASVVK